MEKRCPLCGDRYPASARYCDQDGTELVGAAVGRPRAPRRLMIAGLALVVVLIAAGTLPFLLEHWVTLKIDVELEDVRFGEVGTAGAVPEDGPLGLLDRALDLADQVLGPRELILDLKVDNRTLLPVTVRSLRYVVSIAGEPVAEGVWTPEGDDGGSLLSRRETGIEIAVVPDELGSLGIASDLLVGEVPQVEVSGEVAIAFLGGTFEVPFEVDRLEVELVPAPAPTPRPESPSAPAPPAVPPERRPGSGTA